MTYSVLLIVPRKSGKRPYIAQPHVGLGYLAASLRASGFEVSILDASLENLKPEQIAERAGFADLIGLTGYSCDYNAAVQTVKALRSRWPRPKTVMGGAHFSSLPNEVMESVPEIDFGVVGEGDIALVRLAEVLRNRNEDPAAYGSIDGLVYRDGGRVVVNPRRLPLPAEWPSMPAWNLFQLRRYPLEPNGIFSRMPRVAPIITSRGCPFSCSFCASETLFGRRVRRRSVNQTVHEMDYLANHEGIREFQIQDSAFVVTGAFARELCENLIASNKRYWWTLTSGVRLDAVNPELVRLMESAGCYSMALGIESGSDRILTRMSKNLDVATIRKQVHMVRKNCSIRLTGFFIIGYPDEVETDVAATIRLARELPLDRANFFNYMPFPGTRSYQDLLEQGRLRHLLTDRLYIHDFPFEHPRFRTRWWKSQIRKANLIFYGRPRILRGLAREIRSFAQVKIIARRAASILFT